MSNLRYLRKSRGLTQTDLGNMTGRHYSTIAKYETGVSAPRTAAANLIAAVLGVSVFDLGVSAADMVNVPEPDDAEVMPLAA